MVDGLGAAPQENVTVVINEGVIASVEESAPPADAEIIDVQGKTLLPGLIDAHTHLSSLPGVPEKLRAYGLTKAMRSLLAAGITTVRDLGAFGDSLRHLRTLFKAGCARVRGWCCAAK